MRNLIRINDYSKDEVYEIFKIAEEVKNGKYTDFLKGKSIVMFFPGSSIRTRVTYEKGIYLLGGQSVLFPSDTLDKKENIKDVVGYLNNWADCIIVRHSNIELIEKMARSSAVPIINAMTSVNHPCEILTDLYSLSKLREDYLNAKYLFVGAKGNIGMAWKEASDLFGFELTQSCPVGYEINGVNVEHNLREAIIGKDIVLTDPINKDILKDFVNHQITKSLMDTANPSALLNPCPPFYRGEEVSADVIDSHYFVGYEFKKHLLEVQQAIIIYSLNN
ncbi:ornithine carbamoyltransferase [Sedimentibacter saalensis]|uniref:ornithine carbamoyltransferase n=1 Tax=Sedimentibacter saalensis TaxID=130788 RepID=UPI0028993C4C|nr:peptide transporter [Sedimentibacter saalensis]